ncbi:unnamed protein product [Caenorhabditis auriculariae]|uniref:Glutaredoxin domain-containing protein n=1 Tax=Caenorhabditis auriculariae TaxID=2777116 RepID=A0A8S1GQS0_9PELO|nr:unnamed protein product [Caenorhabditis auriculariae]
MPEQIHSLEARISATCAIGTAQNTDAPDVYRRLVTVSFVLNFIIYCHSLTLLPFLVHFTFFDAEINMKAQAFLCVAFFLVHFISAEEKIKNAHETMTDHIMNDITTHKVMVYSKTFCPYSKKLKKILSNYNIEDLKIVELDEQNDMTDMQDFLKTMSGRTTVPQLFINGRFIGGHDETRAIEDRGELRPLLEKANALSDRNEF